ncbi:hypothetical protein [Albidovulum sp.]|uniref:hypothetical protein n=1 Tax=Albidovulum sp. TaxID=1872424 RepID=UPI0039B89438
MSKITRTTAVVLAAFFGAPAIAATILPDFSAAVFVPGAGVTNPYFLLPAGRQITLAARGEDEGGPFEESTVLSHAGTGRTLLGVDTFAVLDRAYSDGVLMEETHDYYAQDSLGNVWYFGEDVTNYVYDDAGNLIGTNNSSAWLAGVNGALPGFIMPADPQIGMSYFQEFAAADGALDEALVLATGQTLTFGGVTYEDVLVTFESTSLDPTLRELKYYAPGFGIIRVDEGVDEFYRNPDLVFSVAQPAPVPLPAAVPVFAGALIPLLLIGRRHARRRSPA